MTQPLSPATAALPPNAAAAAAIAPTGAFAVLDQFGVIDAIGIDAQDFLHKQLTNDVDHLSVDAAAIGGLCSPKGRLLASFLYWRQVAGTPEAPDAANGIRLLLAADLREAIQKRLSMFVLRAKVKLSDATPQVGLIGLSVEAGQTAPLHKALGEAFETLPDAVRSRVDSSIGTLIRVPDAAGYARYLLAVPRDTLDAVLAKLEAQLPRIASALWDWLDIRSGEPRITTATQDAFVPQMINFEALGGVNFRKGCYPGQEIVARSQYRGTVKRRATVAHAAAAQSGEEVFDLADPLQPCGHIVNAAPAPGGGVDCLVELKLALADDADLHVGSVEGPALRVQGLPYALPELTA